MIHFQWYSFSKLSVKQLYAVLALRSEVFVVEQCCPYLDPDGKDEEALHLLGMEGNTLAAYLRLFPKSEFQQDILFGRVVTAKSLRQKSYGKKLMQELLIYCDRNFPGVTIRCFAQIYLKDFYESFGFHVSGEVYDEDGIAHVPMRKEG